MKILFLIPLLIYLIGYKDAQLSLILQNFISHSSINETDSLRSSSSTLITSLSEDDALELIESKLSEESLRVSYLSLDGKDEEGNYIIRQASVATTRVMEWYHVNPNTKEITCEIIDEVCLVEPEEDISMSVDLSPEQENALQLAKELARTNIGPLYVEGITYIVLTQEENGKYIFRVYNPGTGGIDTLDWITVDLESNSATAMFNKEPYIEANE